MSLRNILLDIATLGGTKLTDETQRNYEIFRINHAAQELYDNNELIGCLREQVINVDVETANSFLVSLPHYVGKLRAVRWFFPNMNLGVVDMRPKYQPRAWQPKNWLSWRLRGESPLSRDITNASLLTVRFKQPVEKAINVLIRGSTDDSQDYTETLAFAAGDQEKTTVASFLSFDNGGTITKDVACQFDCEIIDVDDVVLATIPNNQLQSLFQIIQLINPPNQGTQFTPATQFVEVLWKMRFKPFINLDDEFICPGYDKAIYWKYMEQKCASSSVAEEAARAVGFRLKGDEVLKRIANDTEGIIEKMINFAPNNTYEAFDHIQPERDYIQPLGNPCPFGS